MAKKKKPSISERHYRDMLHLNQAFIDAISRPRSIQPEISEFRTSRRKRPITEKQRRALAKGRRVLASKRKKTLQV
jgi:hypothetical protein